MRGLVRVQAGLAAATLLLTSHRAGRAERSSDLNHSSKIIIEKFLSVIVRREDNAVRLSLKD